jgi:heat shock protein HspQ
MESRDGESSRASFSPGQLVHHLLFDYRGVVVDVDATFCGSDEWYEQVAQSRPPKDAPWYHVLVDGAQHMTYVAERNLEIDPSRESVTHPLLPYYFDDFREGRYMRKRSLN